MYQSSTATVGERRDGDTLRQENLVFAGTAGVSENNRGMGFVPAFMDTATGLIFLSRFADGTPAPVHVLTGLPENLITVRGESGTPVSVKHSVVSGFVRRNTFYSREEAARATA